MAGGNANTFEYVQRRSLDLLKTTMDSNAEYEATKLLAVQGDADAQYRLGTIYDEGRGMTEDARKAAWWFRMAAQQGHANAQCNLGVMYASGRGVAQDDVEAVKWYRLSAAQGDKEAQFMLGIAYGLGRGVQRDLIEAKKWYSKMTEPESS